MSQHTIRAIADQLPKTPGVYLFKDSVGVVIYIGKAKELKKRVLSYFVKQKTDWKVDLLINDAVSIEHILTKTEHEALLLEAELVQRYQPKYNVLLKSGQPFVFLIVTKKDDLPVLELVRAKSKEGTYFGPFMHKQQARAVHDYVLTTFRLYLCNKKIENGCLDFHLGKCAGICKKDFDVEGYLFRFQLALDVLQDNHAAFIKKISEKITEYSKKLEFEKAKNLRDYQQNIDAIFKIIKSKFVFSKYQEKVLSVTSTEVVELTKEYQKTAQELQTLLSLPTIPLTIDCFDISHFQSNSIVGSCVRFTNGKPDKKAFRRFSIKTLVEQNDYAALHEIVSRRYKDPKNLPDLVLIDGGKGQRNAVLSLLPNTPCVSLAKREELLFADAYPEGIHLDLKKETGRLLIALRDYAHHFAITYHRVLRSKKFTR
jgi:excinuclease ABC subunit C